MKRKIALFLSIMMLFAVIIPVQALASDDKGLQNAIVAVKEKISIPAELSILNYNSYTENNRTIWYINWNSKDGSKGGISVRVDHTGTILNYSYYKPYDYTYKKFPKIDKQNALSTAKAFIEKMQPGLLSNLRQTDNYRASLGDTAYYFNFARIVNDIPFYGNNVSVEVNNETGEVMSYSYNWSDDLVFPAPDNKISAADAQKAYQEKLGLKLIYQYSYDDEIVRVYPVYVPKYEYGYAIDAFTGEKVQIDYFYYPSYPGKGLESGAKDEDGRDSVILTPEEQAAIEKVSKLISSEDAEKIARGFDKLELDDTYEMNNVNLYSDWMFKDNFYWRLNFNKEVLSGKEVISGKEKEYYSNASITINALTGEVTSFYKTIPYDENNTKAQYTREQSKAAVEEFLKAFKPDKFGSLEYNDIYDAVETYKEGDVLPTYYYFNFIRKVNGIQFPGNSISVGYDAINGKITSFDMTWFDVSFPALTNVLTANAAHEKLFSNIGLELQYKVTYLNDNEAEASVAVDLPAGNAVPPVSRERADETGPVSPEAVTVEVLSAPSDEAVSESAPVSSDEPELLQETALADDALISYDAVSTDKPVLISAPALADDPVLISAPVGPERSDVKPLPVPTDKVEVKLVYDLKREKPLVLDAYTGTVLDSSGKPYKYGVIAAYTDIAGHYAEKQIKALAEYGIALEGTEFKPNQQITQLEFLSLFSKTLDYYLPADTSSQKEIDRLYNTMISAGIIKENEKKPDSVVTREDVVKYVIRALKYDKVAELQGIFNCPFKDVKEISPELVGYVTIASALKLIAGDGVNFYPKNNMTRAQAAILIYNYLSR